MNLTRQLNIPTVIMLAYHKVKNYLAEDQKVEKEYPKNLNLI